uniref:hypothetical protein n=1 Tax=Algoriphagus sp. TaxID=1872435 RepID=UPI004047B465
MIEEFSIYKGDDYFTRKVGVFNRILSLVKNTFELVLNYIFYDKKVDKINVKKNAYLFFGTNTNELLPYDNFISNLKFDTSNFFIIGASRYKNDFPIIPIYFLSFLFIPYVIFVYIFFSSKENKRSIRICFDQICLSLASVNIINIYLKLLKPQKVFISNHNSSFHLILAMIAKKRGIEIGYFQHALFPNANFFFPSVFDVIFLDGIDSCNKVSNKKLVNSSVYVVGSLFQSVKLELKGIDFNFSIGICVNIADDIDSIIDLLKHLNQNFSRFKIILRPHPSDSRFGLWEMLSNQYNFELYGIGYNLSEFFSVISFLISGESNVHLISLNNNIPSIYYNFKSGFFSDWYGFVNSELLLNGSDFLVLDKFVSNNDYRIINRPVLKMFNNSIDAIYERQIFDSIYLILTDNVLSISDYFYNIEIDGLNVNVLK